MRVSSPTMTVEVGPGVTCRSGSDCSRATAALIGGLKSSRNGYMLSSTGIVMVSAFLVVACDAAEFPQQGSTQPSESVCPQIREIARFRARIPAKGLPVIGWLLNLVY